MTRLLAIFVFFLTLCTSIPAAAQAQTDIFQETLRIGRGAVLNAQWHPNWDLILINTITGAWFYRSDMQDATSLQGIHLGQFNKSGLFAGIDSTNSLTTWDVSTYWNLKLLRSMYGHTAPISALAWSPDSYTIATLDRTGTGIVWNSNTGDTLFTFQMVGADQIVWSEDGTYLAVLDENTGVVSVWDQAGTQVLINYPEFIAFAGITWANDGQLIRWRITGEFFDSFFMDTWNIVTGEAVNAETADESGIRLYSPDNLKLALLAINRGRGTFVKDIASGNIIEVETARAWNASWSPNSQYVAVGEWGVQAQVNIVNVSTGAVTRQGQYIDGVEGFAWSPDSKKLLSYDRSGQIFIDAIDSTVICCSNHIEIEKHSEIGTLASWRDDGSMIAVADKVSGARVWNTSTGEMVAQMGGMKPATHLAWQPNGSLLALSSGNPSAMVWELGEVNPYEPIVVLPHVSSAIDLAWSPDGKTLASAEYTRFIRLWSPDNPYVTRMIDLWTTEFTPSIDNTQSISEIEWSSDSQILDYSFTSSGNGGGVRLIKANDGTKIEGGSPRAGTDWAWTSDNRLVWVRWGFYRGSGSGVVTPAKFDLDLGIGYGADTVTSTWERYAAFDHLPQPIAKAILSPKANKVIGFDVADNAIIWDLEPQSLRVRLYGVNDAVWSPNETMLVTYGVDGVLRVIDSTSGATLHTFDDHFNPAYAGSPDRLKVFWSPDSRKIALLDRGALYIYEMQN